MTGNFLDYVKLGLRQHTGYAQYFFPFFILKQKLVGETAKAAYAQTCEVFKIQQSSIIIQECTQDFDLAIAEYLTQSVPQLVMRLQFPPLVFVLFENAIQSQSALLLLVNHEAFDGRSAYYFTRVFFEVYLHGHTDLVAQYMSDEAFVKATSAVFGLRGWSQLFAEIGSLLFEKIRGVAHCALIDLAAVAYRQLHRSQYASVRLSRANIHRREIGTMNAFLITVIAQELLTMKAQIRIAIPIAFKKRPIDLVGNHVTSFSVTLTNQENILFRIVSLLKKYSLDTKALASYMLFTLLKRKGGPTAVYQFFSDWSRCTTAYISNYGYFSEAHELIAGTGGFNSPVQAALGMVFTITYHAESVYIGLACSDQIMNKEHMSVMLHNIKNTLERAS